MESSAASDVYKRQVERMFDNDPTLPDEGNHIFNIRVKDEDGNWSSTFSKIVLVHANIDSRDILLQEAEYFWNEDPGQGLATTVLPFDGDFNKAVEQLFVEEVSLPDLGNNIFNIRVKDEDGNWGSIFSKAVMVNPGIPDRIIQVQEGEYFWDDDPGEGCLLYTSPSPRDRG